MFQSDLSNSTSVDFRYLLYITDESLDHTDYRIIKVKDTCHIQQPIGGTIVTKDVLHSNGILQTMYKKRCVGIHQCDSNPIIKISKINLKDRLFINRHVSIEYVKL